MATPEPAGHYSAYIKANGFIFTAGQLPIVDLETKEVPEAIEEQTAVVLEKIEALLAREGLDRGSVVKTTAFISDVADWGAVNGVYRTFFGDHKPACSIVPVSRLHHGCKIEIEAIAAAPSGVSDDE